MKLIENISSIYKRGVSDIKSNYANLLAKRYGKFIIVISMMATSLLVISGASAYFWHDSLGPTSYATQSEGLSSRSISKNSSDLPSNTASQTNGNDTKKTTAQSSNQPNKTNSVQSNSSTSSSPKSIDKGTDFSLSTPTVTVHTNSSSSYITASTLNGSSVSWQNANPSTPGVYIIYDSFPFSPTVSIAFRVKVESYVPEGTYTVTIQTSTPQSRSSAPVLVQKNITVNVPTPDTFEINSVTDDIEVNDDGSNLQIPFSINRNNPTGEPLSVSATISSAPDFHRISNIYARITSASTGIISIDIPDNTPPGVYIVRLYVDNSTMNDTADFGIEIGD